MWFSVAILVPEEKTVELSTLKIVLFCLVRWLSQSVIAISCSITHLNTVDNFKKAVLYKESLIYIVFTRCWL